MSLEEKRLEGKEFLELERVLERFSNIDSPEIKDIVEKLSAIISFCSLDKEDKKVVGVHYHKELDPLLLALFEKSKESREVFQKIEKYLIPLSYLGGRIYKIIGVTDEELKNLQKYRELLNKKVFKIPVLGVLLLKGVSHFKKDWREALKAKKRIDEKIITSSSDYMEVLGYTSKTSYKAAKVSNIPIYILVALLHWLRTLDPTVLAVYISSILLSQQLGSPYTLEKIKSRRYKEIAPYLQTLVFCSGGAYIYHGTLDPILLLMYALSILPFWVGGAIQMATSAELFEKLYPYLPRWARKAINKVARFVGGVKIKPFNEREIYEELYEATFRVEKVSSLPSEVFQDLRDRLNKKLIKVEDPDETLIAPYKLGYCRQDVILIEDENGIRYVSEDARRALEEIAIAYGESIGKFERKVMERPSMYLEVICDKESWDPSTGKRKICRKYGRSVIGIYNLKDKRLMRGIAAREVWRCALNLYAHYLFVSKRISKRIRYLEGVLV